MYEIFEQLLQSYGITAYKFCQDTKISQSTISTWKKKKNLISPELAKIISKYFNVSVDYLMTGKEKESQQYYLNDETREIAQEIFENKELRILFDASRKAKPEDLLFVAEMMKKLKEKEHND